jgi:hypothetical protein
VLLHNGEFCNGCITKGILLLQAFHSQENQYYADYDKKYYNFYYLIFYNREIVKLDNFMPLSFCYANTVLCAAVAKSTVLEQQRKSLWVKDKASQALTKIFFGGRGSGRGIFQR